MNKSLKILIAVSITMLLLLGVALSQFAGAERNTDAEQYKEALNTFFSSGNLGYDYKATYNLDDSLSIESSGKIIKSGQDFIDSNEQYYKIMLGNTFLNVDFGMKSVFVVDINKMEKTMGFVKSDLNSGLFDVTDSNYAALGTWKVTSRTADANVIVEFKIADTANQPIDRVIFGFIGDEIESMDVHFNNNGELGSGVSNLTIKMSNFRNDGLNLGERISEIVRLDKNSVPILLNQFKDYQLKQL